MDIVRKYVCSNDGESISKRFMTDITDVFSSNALIPEPEAFLIGITTSQATSCILDVTMGWANAGKSKWENYE